MFLRQKDAAEYSRIKREAWFIAPQNPLIMHFLIELVDGTKHLLEPNLRDIMKRYYTNLRLNISRADRISCDFCSIANGYLQALVDNVNWQTARVSDITLFELKLLNRYLCYTLARRQQPALQATGNDVKHIIETIHLNVEEIELQFCPFKSFQEQYYRNKDIRYLAINEETIKEAGRVLAANQVEQCLLCSPTLNNEMDKRFMLNTSDPATPIDDLFNYLFP